MVLWQPYTSLCNTRNQTTVQLPWKNTIDVKMCKMLWCMSMYVGVHLLQSCIWLSSDVQGLSTSLIFFYTTSLIEMHPMHPIICSRFLAKHQTEYCGVGETLNSELHFLQYWKWNHEERKREEKEGYSVRCGLAVSLYALAVWGCVVIDGP